jgi:ABC-type glycerol-3-phosphate transport system substrate-binding protein
MTTPVRSVPAAFLAVAALVACSSSKSAGPSSDAASPTPDGASGVTYWMAPRTSEIDLQLVTTQPAQGF